MTSSRKRQFDAVLILGALSALLASPASAACVPTVPFEARLAAPTPGDVCSDGIDNDCDGYFDSVDTVTTKADDNCLVETRWASTGPYSLICNDGFDNDGNGLRDGQGGTAVPTPPITQDPNCRGEVYCYDEVNNDGDAAGLIDANDIDCQCMGAQNCTANDFSVAFTADPVSIVDGCINTSDRITVSGLLATLQSANPDRPDLTLWVATDGANAQSGSRCLKQIFTPVLLYSPYPAFIPAPGPYPVLEAKVGERDTCGDLGTGIGGSYEYPMPVTVPCNDALANGFVELGQCGSWQVNDKAICSSVTEGLPQTTSKCQCAVNETGLPGPNARILCAAPTITGGNADTNLDPGETYTSRINLSNQVAGCDPTTPAAADTYGRQRCGTSGFLAYVLSYADLGASAVTWNALTDDGFGFAAMFNDTANKRLIWVPANHVVQPEIPAVSGKGALGVVSPNWAANTTTNPRFMEFSFTLGLGPAATGNLRVATYWSNSPIDTNLNGLIGFTVGGEWDTWFANATLQGDPPVVTIPPTPPGNCNSGCSCSFGFTTTPVTLEAFSATDEGGGLVRFEWTATDEVNNVGYQLYAQTAEGRVALLDEPVATRSGDGLGAETYELSLFAPEGALGFVLQDIDVKGKTRDHGPYQLGSAHGKKLEAEAIPWPRIRAEHDREQAKNAAASRRLAAVSVVNGRAPSSTTSASPNAELRVSTGGIQRVTFEQLLAAGVNVVGLSPQKLVLRDSGGVAVPFRIGGGLVFGVGTYMEFVGNALDTLYTGTNVYRLGPATKSVALLTDASPPGAVAATFYQATSEFERNRFYSFSSPLFDPFFDTRLFAFSTPVESTFNIQIDGYQAGAATPRMTVRFYGGSVLDPEPDHHVVVKLNGTEVGQSRFDGYGDGTVTVDVPAGLLHNGSNALGLRQPADTGAWFDLVYFDGFQIDYPRAFVAVSDRLDFTAAGQRFEVSGFSTSSIVAYRLGSKGVELLTGLQVVSESSGFKAILPGSAQPARYLVASSAGLVTPLAAAGRLPVDIQKGSAEYLVISHPNFISGLDPLVAARQAQGFDVKVVNVEDVYAQFSGGVIDAAAIRKYIAHAVARMGTDYVLLVGGDSYDYRGYLGLGAISFMPSLYVDTGDVTFTPSDSALADVDGDGLQDVAIGRFPVRTADELATVISKTLTYAARDTHDMALFAADSADMASAVSFRSASETMLSKLASGWNSSRAYVDQLGLAGARAVLSAAFAEGVPVVCYVGHSGPTNWGDPSNVAGGSLLQVSEVAALDNDGRPAVVSQFGCWNTYYTHPSIETLGVKLLVGGYNGAAAVMGATALTKDTSENALGERLFGRLTTSGVPVGWAIAEAKAQLTADEGAKAFDEFKDVLYGWNLLGDPALVVKRQE